MSIIELREGNCRNCYKCIRGCHVKAIAFKDGHTKVMDNECVLCGECIINCPQNAKYIQNDVEGVRRMLAAGERVYVTLAPSWQGWYPNTSFAKVSAALKKLGFAGVEETAIGANATSAEYANLLKNGNMKNIIVTACSSVVMMIERHYPDLVPMLAPVSSPMMAHARLMRQTYGDIKVVFVGPCLSKKFEASDPLAGGLVDAALTFYTVDDWLREEGISIEAQDLQEDPQAAGVVNTRSRLYPKATGILATIPQQNFYSYRPIAVDGIDRCMDLFETMQDEDISGYFVEANMCSGGCLGGPAMRVGRRRLLLSESRITDKKQPQDEHPAATASIAFPHPRVFTNRFVRSEMPTEEEIREILAKTGKVRPEDELNCGSCGYASCREKAIAVYQGKADINMCLPFFRDRAENISNTVLEHSPNAIFAFDDNLCLQSMNPTAESMFRTPLSEAAGLPFPAFFGETAFDEAKDTQCAVKKNVWLPEVEKSVEQTIIYIKEHHTYLAFLKDVTEELTRREHLEGLRDSTIDMAQKVIEKQMIAAQEIASLLGETTAETKVALTNLKKSMKDLAQS